MNELITQTDYFLLKNLENTRFVLKTKQCEYNYVVLNETCFGNKIGQYLLQTRTIEKINNNDVNIQECCSLYRYAKQDFSLVILFDFSFVWNYTNNKTCYVVTWTSNITKDIVSQLLAHHPDFEFLSDEIKQAKFSLHGLTLKIM